MSNSAAMSLLIQHYQKEKVTFESYDIESLKAMLQLRQKSYIDDKGQVTDLGIARSLMGLFDLRLLDVLALAYVASKPVNASRSLLWIWHGSLVLQKRVSMTCSDV